jgi:hypothetical protein
MDIPPFVAVVYATGVAALFSLIARGGSVPGWVKDMVEAPWVGVPARAGDRGVRRHGSDHPDDQQDRPGPRTRGRGVQLARAIIDNATAVLVLTAPVSAVAVGVPGARRAGHRVLHRRRSLPHQELRSAVRSFLTDGPGMAQFTGR